MANVKCVPVKRPGETFIAQSYHMAFHSIEKFQSGYFERKANNKLYVHTDCLQL